MLPARPWKPEILIRLLVGMLLCVLLGVALSAVIGASGPDAPRRWLLGSGAALCLTGALGWLLRTWGEEAFVRNAAVLLVLVFVGLNLVTFAAHGTRSESTPTLAQIILSTLSLQAAALGVVAWALRRHGMTWGEAFGLHHRAPSALGWGILGGAALLPVLWLTQLACVMVLKRFGLDAEEQTLVQVLQKLKALGPQLYLAFAAVVLAPISEEVLFRGILYPALRQYFRPRLAMWISAIGFGAFHANLPTFLPLTIMGLALCWLYDRRGNLLAPIAAHACFNAANLVLLYFTVRTGTASP